MNSYIIEKLKEGRMNAKLKQSEVAEMIGIKGNTLSNYENGVSEPDIDTFCALCDIYNIDPYNIINAAYGISVQGENFKIRPSEIEVAKKYRFISTHSPNGASVVDTVLNREYAIAQQLQEKDGKINELEKNLIPKRIFAYYGKIAAAGTSVEFSGMAAGIKSYPQNDINENADYVIGVSGASMEPEYYDGDIVYVQKSEHLSVGDIGIFQKANSIYIKKVGEAGLISLNPDYPGLIADGDIITVLGRVLGKAED